MPGAPASVGMTTLPHLKEKGWMNLPGILSTLPIGSGRRRWHEPFFRALDSLVVPYQMFMQSVSILYAIFMLFWM
jgi:hypothetical protein